ncbi:hypothetical protein TNCV_1191181 [Trichonephila clavipes]|nr:hypothetical protein TNCV_1191181 [Trichonephila clavipes]
MAEEMETSKKLIQAILDKGHTEDPFLVETMKHLETCSEQHQQAVTNESETHLVAVKQSPKRTSPIKNTNPDTPKLPPPPC